MASKNRSNSNIPNRLSVADRTELLTKTGTREGEVLLQRDIGLLYTWTDTQGTDNGGTILNVGTGSWIASATGDLNVSWFGAKGDGATDDTSAIQATLDAAFYLSKNVFVSRGRYLISSQLTIQRAISVFGEDKYNTKILTETPSINVLYVTGIYLGTISKLSIVSDADDVIGIYLDTVTRIDVSECEFLGCRYSWHAVDGGHHNYSFITSRASGTQESGGFWMGSSQGGYDGTVEGETEGAGNYGAVVSTITSCSFQVESVSGRPEYIKLKRNANLLITNSEFIGLDSTCDCFTIHDDAQGIHITNCAINSWGRAFFSEIGTYVSEHNREPRAITFTNVEFDQNLDNSIFIQEGSTMSFIACTITSSNRGTASTPIYCGVGSEKIEIQSNTIAGYYSTGSKSIHLDGADRVNILNNNFGQCDIAIQFADTPEGTVVRNNEFASTIVQAIGGAPNGSTNAIGENHDTPLKNVAPAIPATTELVTNYSGYDCNLVVEYASDTDSVNVILNNTVYLIDRYIHLPLRAGASYSLTYNTPPTSMKWLTK